MIVFKVELNGAVLSLAGKDDLCVLSAIVGATGVLGLDSGGTKTEKDKADLRLNLSGLGARSDDDPGVHYTWIHPKTLSLGDKISITILDQENADSVNSEKPSKTNEDLKREAWERSKEHYFELKDKYEIEN